MKGIARDRPRVEVLTRSRAQKLQWGWGLQRFLLVQGVLGESIPVSLAQRSGSEQKKAVCCHFRHTLSHLDCCTSGQWHLPLIAPSKPTDTSGWAELRIQMGWIRTQMPMNGCVSWLVRNWGQRRHETRRNPSYSLRWMWATGIPVYLSWYGCLLVASFPVPGTVEWHIW